MSDIVKCANCNIVINELLAFLRNVLDFMDEESIHQLCTTSFSAEDIVKAKCLLYDSLPNVKKMPQRRKQDKKRMSRDLDDIISLMKSADPQIFPIFVARDLHLIPPVTFDHVDVTRFLKELLWLKNRLSVVETRTCEQFNQLKIDVEHIKHVPEYVPIKTPQISGMSGVDNSIIMQASFNEIENTLDMDKSISLSCEKNEMHISQLVEARAGSQPHTMVSTQKNESGCRASLAGSANVGVKEAKQSPRVEDQVTRTMISTQREILSPPKNYESGSNVHDINENQHVVSENVLYTSNSSATRPTVCNGSLEMDLSVNCDLQVKDTEWQIVRNKSAKRYKLVGQRGCAPTALNGKFRAADVKIPILISNVSKETSQEDIINYIKSQTDECVSLKKINMREAKIYNSYKLYVSKHKLDIFLNDKFWPNGISFRRFVYFKYKTNPENIVKVI